MGDCGGRHVMFLFFFFFFQAEDGIRDLTVTGVQTCALPISPPRPDRGWIQEAALRMLMNTLDPDVAERPQDLVVYGGTGKAARDWPAFDRSEERRVGEEGRSRWSPYH